MEQKKLPTLKLTAPPPDAENRSEDRSKEKPAVRSSYFASLLLATVNRLDSAAKVRESLAFVYWARVVGPQAAAATEVESVRDGVLFIRTKSSVWSHELTLHKEQILSGLNRLLGGKVIIEIVYKARGVKKKAAAPPEPDMPALEEIDAVVLDPAEQVELSQKLRSLDSIKSDRIRDVMASRMVRDTKLRHWRIARGWKICPRCAGVHKTDYNLCPLCRLCR